MKKDCSRCACRDSGNQTAECLTGHYSQHAGLVENPNQMMIAVLLDDGHPASCLARRFLRSGAGPAFVSLIFSDGTAGAE